MRYIIYIMKNLLSIVVLAMLVISCKKEDSPVIMEDSPVIIEDSKINLMIETVVNGNKIVKNTEYISKKDTFSITQLRYYISNVTLINSNNNQRTVIPKSYLLFDLDNGGMNKFPLSLDKNVKFDKIEVSFGIDSVANHSISHTEGDLDPSGNNGMIWTWNTGYKFIRFEGETKTGNFIVHRGKDLNYTTITLNASGDFKQGNNYTIHIQAELLALLNGTHKIDLDNATGHGGSGTKGALFQNAETDFLKIHHLGIQ